MALHRLAFAQRLQQLDRPPSSHADEDDFGVLDDSILERSSSDMSSSLNHRSESFIESATTFSASESAWPTFQFGSDNAFHLAHSTTNSFLPSHAAVFPSTTPPENAHFPSQQIVWPLVESSGSCTPTAGPESLLPEYEDQRPTAYGQEFVHPSRCAPHKELQLQTRHGFLSNSIFPTSPQSSKDWISNSADPVDFRSISSQPRQHSPTFLGTTNLLRRDGIRKKNARFEIPAERNLRTIDQLINQTNDEQEIKELKQQKRLLRNRQAALDSRQRKKQHTERLEDEKKHYTAVISDLEEALGEMKIREAEWNRAKQGWAATQHQYQQFIDALVMEKEELVRSHTVETGELRKKNAFFAEQIYRMEGSAMSAAPSSTGFSADFSDFDHLTMNSSPWDEFPITNHFSVEAEPPSDPSMARATTLEKSTIKEEDKAATSGFLLMLLLCGAWVASRGSIAASKLLPTMPEEMRAASATVLEHIYQDAGLQLEEMIPLGPPIAETVRGSCKTTLTALEIASLSDSPLGVLHHQLVTPNKKQLREQTFSLTPQRYNDISSDPTYVKLHGSDSNPRKNLRETLVALRGSNPGTAAEAYTRSLMWDKIPQQVLEDFARMVTDSNPGESQWKVETLP